MAFMMPVMKNNYDIYKDTRSRKTSECSNGSSTGPTPTIATPANAMGPSQRRRKVSECKSESFATSPSHGQLGGVGAHRMQMQRCHSSKAFPRNASRSSHGSIMTMVSPTRSSPPSRTQTASALERQAQAAVQRQQQLQQQNGGGGGGEVENDATNGSNDYTKFHLRLVDKLRKSFRKDSGKRS